MLRLHARLGWLVAAGLCIAQARGESALSEYQVKAAFVYKFATYIRWPPRTGLDASSPFVICVIGRDPFGRELDAVMHGQNIHGRRIVVKRLARPEEAARCDVLFIGSSERAALPQILDAVHNEPVLTVGDMDHFAELGGMINLTTEDNHIRFDINKGAIDRAGLKAASQLLGLARIVDEEKVR
ncbi:MAG TPA: YfiR family protein [Thermoanaerobaculia bacterium]|jgi:hypothetical protein|nr:YfiR family protein [Thermoanaerobaculia bacterium]